MLLLTKSEGAVDPLLEQNLRYGNPTAPIAECRHQSCYFVSQNGAMILPLDAISGKKVALFCGIASPAGFEQLIVRLGAKVIYKKRYLDHHRFSGAELSSIDEHALNADYLITTEKDVVRIPKNYPFHTPLYYVRVDIRFLRNECALRNLLENALSCAAVP
ncbi:MAG: tetraacyldisaccharide 4'-kinase [Opitutales bacterium]|nr:tetraacyldisaccharide 4'-kinase [Opitutales bacterium]